MSPPPLQAGIITKVAPSSGGTMGQGLGMIGRIGGPASSEANSTSFYSNHTTANLNNSRYLLQGRDNKIVVPQQNVGKVMPPIMKSIDNAVVYGSHSTNFQQDQQSNVRNSSYPMNNDAMQTINKINQINKLNNNTGIGMSAAATQGTHSGNNSVNQSSFYSSQAHSIQNGIMPIGSANYEKIQARYALSKDFTSSFRPLNATSTSPYDQGQMPAVLGQGGPLLQSGSPFDDPSLQMHRIIKQRDRSTNNAGEDGQYRANGQTAAPSLNSTANMQNGKHSKYQEIIKKKKEIANMI